MSNRELDRSTGATGRDSTPWLRRAWTGVALVPLFFILAFAVGEGIYALMGYKPENADAPAWAVVVASALTVLVVLTPCAAAVYCGWRTIKDGDRRGAFPAVVGTVAAAGVVALTVVNEIGNVVR